MKRCVVSIAILLVVALVAGTVLAEKKKGKGKAEQPILVQPRVEKSPEKLGRRGRMSSEEARTERKRDQEEMYRGMAHKEQLRKTNEQIEKRRGEHEKFVGELKAIKKLALEEKAEKTANRIQQLIDKSTGRFNEDIRKLEQKRDRTREQMEKQAEQHMRRREQLMERKEQQQQKAEAEGKADRGKGKGGGKGKGKSEDESEAEGRKSR
jgi:hypothetical protein